MSCRPAPPIVYDSGMVLGQNNNGTYMRANLSGQDHNANGIDLTSVKRGYISSDQQFGLLSPILNPNASVVVSPNNVTLNAAVVDLNAIGVVIAGDSNGIALQTSNGGIATVNGKEILTAP